MEPRVVSFVTDKRFVRRRRGLRTIGVMARMYCRHHHGGSALCPECSELMAYARFASGYRAGGPNSNFDIFLGIPKAFEPDETKNYELGFKGFEANGWLGILVPNGTPPAIVAQLNAALTKAMENAELKKTLLATGIESRTGTPQEFAALLQSDTATWHKIVETAGIKAE